MRDLPHAELAVSTRCEKHVLLFIVVDHANLLCELGLQLEHALAALLDVAYAQIAPLSAFHIA